VGLRTKELVEIQSGIKENDAVITQGGYAVPDGTKITVETAPATEREKEKDSADSGDRKDSKTDKKPAAVTAPKKGKE
jgi:hypothetical protein